MLTVFLSSTYKDLIEHRTAVIEAIDSLDGYKCIRMEQFGARDASAAEFCAESIEGCDLFIGVLGHNYGSVDPKIGKSFTELELETAVRLRKPRLIFLSREDAPVPMQLVDPDDLRRRQARLRREHASERIRDTFTTPGDLSQRVLLAIRNWENSSAAGRDLAEPLPPQPRFEHPYPLQENFTGRKRERDMLTTWFTDDDNPILALTAIGGMGKSALAWAWLQRDVLGLPLPGTPIEDEMDVRSCRAGSLTSLRGVFWWSFYEGQANFSAFLDAALHYVTGGEKRRLTQQSETEKAKLLAAYLQRERLLFVLDGFERELSGYASLNAAYQGDAVDDRDRQLIDPGARDLFRFFLSGLGPSRILITTRLFPIDLEGRAGCRREDLLALAPEDAEAFLRAQGVRGGSVEMRAACEAYGYHALAVRLLAGFVVSDAVSPGDVRVAVDYDANNRLVARKHHVLELAYNALGSSERMLLSQLAAFRFPVNYLTLERTLCVSAEDDHEDLSFWRTMRNLYARERHWHKRKELRSSLGQLLKRGLVFFDRERQRYDLHPIVRHYAYDRLADKKGMHTRLIDYYQVIPATAVLAEQSLEDLAPVVELFHHTVRARHYENAFRLFTDRLQEVLLKRFCAVHLYASLVDVFFDSTDSVVKDLPGPARVMATAFRAHALKLSGETTRALVLYEKAISTFHREKNERELSMAYLHQGLTYFAIGDLGAAERRLWSAVKGCDYHRQREYSFLAQEMLLQIYALAGRDEEYEQIAAALSALPMTFNRIEAKVFKCLFDDDLGPAVSEARCGIEVARETGNELDVIRAKCLLGTTAARHCFESRSRDILATAEQELKESHERCLSIRLIELECETWIGFSWLYLANGDVPSAKESARRAQSIAEKSAYKLKLASIYWVFAEIDLDSSDSQSALSNFERAREIGYCSGPPWYQRRFVEKMDRRLTSLRSSPLTAKKVS